MKITKLLFSSLIVALLCSFTYPTGNSAPVTNDLLTENLLPGGAYLVFAEKFGGSVTKDQIAGVQKLEVRGCAAGSKIFSYTLEITRAGKTASFTAKSNVLSKEMLAGLKALRAGDSFQFKKTKAYLPNGKDVVDVHSRIFEVV